MSIHVLLEFLSSASSSMRVTSIADGLLSECLDQVDFYAYWFIRETTAMLEPNILEKKQRQVVQKIGRRGLLFVALRNITVSDTGNK
ncbi:hypothetical protein AVEN_3939-1 [Araneus ventricosus]|uniref:Uncharacterized protein n=1 Tax=Araneus ventricosus TaxID=182803 RepID=A0A4Y2L1D9_ARAVE|nr:hypothetical protein AVEN_3939-1 [Araneus ventricosus]